MVPWTSRLYKNDEDLIQMQAMLMEARLLTSDWRYWHVGELNWWFFMLDCHLNPQEFIRLWHDNEGKLIGFAILGEDPSIDWQVLPGYEWRGIEVEVIAWMETRLKILHSSHAQQWSSHVVSGARQDDQKRIAFLEQHRFRYCGEFAEVNMLRWLDQPVPELILPPGYQIRALGEVGEISKRAAAQRQVWHPWSVGNVSDEDYERFILLPGYYRDLDVVAVTPEGVIASYVNGWLDPLNRIGDFGPVGALPDYRRQGLTRAVLLEGLRRMKARGMERVCVSTGISNIAAIGLYESVGFKIMNKYLDYHLELAECQ